MKYIFLDVDGTLCMPSVDVSELTRYAIQQARENGHKVFICSGRNKAGLSEVMKIGFDGMVASAGGYIEVEGHKIYDCFLDNKTVAKARRVFDQAHVYYDLEATDKTYQSHEMQQLFAFGTIPEKMNSEMQRLMAQHKERFASHDLEEYDGSDPIHKICFIAKDLKDLEEPKRELSDQFRFVVHDIFDTDTINGEIIDLRVDKGKGIQRVLHYDHGDMKDTLGFGDSMNDLEMIQACHIGVVMGNGSPELKTYANLVCESVEGEGIYHEFIRQGFIKPKRKED